MQNRKTSNNMKLKNRIVKTLTAITLTLTVASCIVADIKTAGVFKKPVKYDNRETAYIDIPLGVHKKENLKYLTREEKDGSKIGFVHLGSCGGGGMLFSGIMLPIIPIPYYAANTCEKNGFRVSHQTITDTLGVKLQLYYNAITHDPFIDNGSIKFKIEDFPAFKNAKDKTLIIHKKKPDGTMWSKELPFDWKIVVSVEGGL